MTLRFSEFQEMIVGCYRSFLFALMVVMVCCGRYKHLWAAIAEFLRLPCRFELPRPCRCPLQSFGYLGRS